MPLKDPAKLTLRLERDAIEAARRYAEKQGTSLSKLVEEHFRRLAEEDEPAWIKELHPKTRAMIGIGRPRPGEKPVDEKDYWRYLEEKYR